MFAAHVLREVVRAMLTTLTTQNSTNTILGKLIILWVFYKIPSEPFLRAMLTSFTAQKRNCMTLKEYM